MDIEYNEQEGKKKNLKRLKKVTTAQEEQLNQQQKEKQKEIKNKKLKFDNTDNEEDADEVIKKEKDMPLNIENYKFQKQESKQQFQVHKILKVKKKQDQFEKISIERDDDQQSHSTEELSDIDQQINNIRIKASPEQEFSKQLIIHHHQTNNINAAIFKETVQQCARKLSFEEDYKQLEIKDKSADKKSQLLQNFKQKNNICQQEVQQQRKKSNEQEQSQKKRKASIDLKKQKQQNEKEVQQHQNMPLQNTSFVLTGEFHQISKDQIKEIIKYLGGKTPESVSKKTKFVIYGNILQDGRPPEESRKYRDAKQTNIETKDQQQFSDYLKQITGKSLIEWFNEINDKKLEVDESPLDLHMQVKKEDSSQLWTQKYAPTKIKNIIGNFAEIQKIVQWLDDWKDVIIQGHKKELKPYRGQWQNTPNANAKACLISGPPGIGKTSAIRVIAKEKGYQLIETNASDIRNKAQINQNMSHLSDNMLITLHSKKDLSSKVIILMDECDGMSSGDRGGNQALIQLIKNTKNPIICICNDRQHPKIRTLANHCYDIRFSKPMKGAIAKQMVEIASNEGLVTNQNTIELLCEQLGNDIRQILNFLQMRRRTHSHLDLIQAKKGLSFYKKDHQVQIGPFEATSLLLNRREFEQISIKEKTDLFFVDYNLIPLLFQENFLNSIYFDNTKFDNQKKYKILNQVNEATFAIAHSDIISKMIQTSQNYSLLPNLGFQGVIYPSFLCSQILQGYCKFPEFFGKFSSTKKQSRLINEFKMACAGKIQGTKNDFKFDYAPTLFQWLLNILSRNNDLCVHEALGIMEYYGISPEIFKEHLVEIQFNPKKIDLLVKINTKTKTALTKLFNKRNQDSLKGIKQKKQKNIQENGDVIQYNEFTEGIGEKQQLIFDEDDEDLENENDSDEIQQLLKKGNKETKYDKKPKKKQQIKKK